MALYPGAKQRHIKVNYQKIETEKNCVLYHVAASGADSLYGWFSNPTARASSHFYVAYDGNVEQYLDTKYISWANASGNRRSVTIETAGQAAGEWTSAQVVSLVKLTVWICESHGIPITQMRNSKANETGIGWHRLGIDGNFPASPSILAGRNQRGGGESWSGSRGKVCPGTERIKQIPGIIAAVRAYDNNDNKPSPAPKPKPKPKPKPVERKTSGKLKVDGWLGGATVRDLQRLLGTPVDGILSGQYRSKANRNIAGAQWVTYKGSVGSSAVRELQRRIGVTPDGLLGPDTIRGLQRRFGTPVDGVISGPSTMVKALQERLNEDRI